MYRTLSVKSYLSYKDVVGYANSNYIPAIEGYEPHTVPWYALISSMYFHPAYDIVNKMNDTLDMMYKKSHLDVNSFGNLYVEYWNFVKEHASDMDRSEVIGISIRETDKKYPMFRLTF